MGGLSMDEFEVLDSKRMPSKVGIKYICEKHSNKKLYEIKEYKKKYIDEDKLQEYLDENQKISKANNPFVFQMRALF